MVQTALREAEEEIGVHIGPQSVCQLLQDTTPGAGYNGLYELVNNFIPSQQISHSLSLNQFDIIYIYMRET